MRIPSSKPPFIETTKAPEKKAAESSARSAETSAAPASSAALPSTSLGHTVQNADVASREFEQTIAARLDEVREQLKSGNYVVDYDRLAKRIAEEGLGS